MPKNKIGDLRNLMFETIERLMDDEDEGMDTAKAKAIADVGKVIVDSARVEAQFLKQIGAGSSEFLQNGNGEPKQIGSNSSVLPVAAFGKADKCLDHAALQGYSKEEAQNCENYSVGCLDCPFK